MTQTVTLPSHALPSHALAVGMIVRTHGSRWELVECWCDADKAKAYAINAANATQSRWPDDAGAISEAWNREITLRSFLSRYLGPVHEGAHESVPLHWREDWTIQGNARAYWTVEVDEPHPDDGRTEFPAGEFPIG